MKKALIVYGGWDGHEPQQVAEYFKTILEENNFSVELSDTLSSFENSDKLLDLDLIVPVWTMGKITKEQVENVSEAVASGVGLAGCHGGMCDAFRENVLWQFITGGNWVSHPGGDGVEYTVNIIPNNPLTENIKDFKVKSEHYYLHVDPAIEILATTKFPKVNWYHSSNKEVDVPVAWTKKWGVGRVYYNSLGHHADIVKVSNVTEMIKRGFLWASEGKDAALLEGKDISIYKNNLPMY